MDVHEISTDQCESPSTSSNNSVATNGVTDEPVASTSTNVPSTSFVLPRKRADTHVRSSNGVPRRRGRPSTRDLPPVLEDYSVSCARCGVFGVKKTYAKHNRNFCSTHCSKLYMFKMEAGLPKTSATAASDADVEDMDTSSRCSSPDHGTGRSSSSASTSVNDYDAEGAPRKKKKKVEETTFDWKLLLDDSNFTSAGITFMKHAPLSRMWENITVGMKLEVENKDIDPRNHQIAFWVASVMKIQGYYVQLRFEGFGSDSTGDFWINLCSSEIHHVGWCANKGKPLIPPRTIARKFTDWRNFLVNRLTGARTLPQNFLTKVENSLKSKYEIGDQLEVVDKNRICQLRLATVRKIVGRRLQVEYFDSDDDGGFWCHEESRLIHPKGWAMTIGHEIVAPKFYNPNGLLPTPYDAEFEELDLQVGMKLEAIDPLNLSAICAASIKKVLRRGYVMVRVDCYEEDSSSNGSDWFCYHISSPYVFPCGFCAENNIPLTPPFGYDKDTFKWSDYMTNTNYRAAPVKPRKLVHHKFQQKMRVEAADLMDPRLICVASITKVVGRLLKIHFDGWEEEYDQWLDARSPDIYPVGWCELVGHKLEAPRPPAKPLQPVKKGKKGKKKTATRGKGPGRPCKVQPYVIEQPVNTIRAICGTKSSITLTLEQSSVGRIPLNINNDMDLDDLPPVIAPPVTANVVKKSITRVAPLHISESAKKASQIAPGPRRSSLLQQVEQAKSDPPIKDPLNIASGNANPPSAAITEDDNQIVPTVPNMKNEEAKPMPVTLEGMDVNSIEKVNGNTEENVKIKTELSRTSSTDSDDSSPSTHIIPRLTENPSCCENVEPSLWKPRDVVAFLNANDCGAHSDRFQRNKITGQGMLVLTKDQIVILTGMKVGPAVKIVDLIGQLKRLVTAAKARTALTK